jgi:hypothetical protein
MYDFDLTGRGNKRVLGEGIDIKRCFIFKMECVCGNMPKTVVHPLMLALKDISEHSKVAESRGIDELG